MKNLKTFYLKNIDGHKTYGVAVVIGLLNAAVALGWISPAHLTQINTVLGALGLGAVRSAINKV